MSTPTPLSLCDRDSRHLVYDPFDLTRDISSDDEETSIGNAVFSESDMDEVDVADAGDDVFSIACDIGDDADEATAMLGQLDLDQVPVSNGDVENDADDEEEEEA